MPLPDPNAPFTLNGCWEVWERMSKPDDIRRMIELLERSVKDGPEYAFDAAKNLIESTCKTILQERSLACDEGWDVPKLLKETLKALNLVPDGYAAEVAEVMRKIAGGLQTTVQSLGELRNKAGGLGHGRVANTQHLEALQAVFAARAADTVVHLMYMAHVEYLPKAPPLLLEDNPNFNEYVDELHEETDIFEARYKASEILYRVDLEAYRDYLTAYLDEQNAETVTEEESL